MENEEEEEEDEDEKHYALRYYVMKHGMRMEACLLSGVYCSMDGGGVVLVARRVDEPGGVVEGDLLRKTFV